MIDKQTRIVTVAGPTASGKSALALAIARRYGGTVINADSMQVYRDLQILTARPDDADLAAAPHRLYGVLEVPEVGSAGWWRNAALAEIGAAAQAGSLAVMTGGTGLYLRSLLRGIADMPVIPAAVRDEARALLRAIGVEALHARLAAQDPETAARLRPSDPQRVVRAWEVLQASGRGLSAWQAAPTDAFPGSSCTILLSPPPAVLAPRIEARLRAMVTAGALEEVRGLRARLDGLDHPLAQAVGVPQFAACLAGDIGLDAAIEQAIIATRQYAKRQRTWFRHQLECNLVISQALSAQEYAPEWGKIFSFIDGFLLTGPS
jgi:tRNA dimethylallyltransferase